MLIGLTPSKKRSTDLHHSYPVTHIPTVFVLAIRKEHCTQLYLNHKLLSLSISEHVNKEFFINNSVQIHDSRSLNFTVSSVRSSPGTTLFSLLYVTNWVWCYEPCSSKDHYDNKDHRLLRRLMIFITEGIKLDFEISKVRTRIKFETSVLQ